jgi:hypothetical protein
MRGAGMNEQHPDHPVSEIVRWLADMPIERTRQIKQAVRILSILPVDEQLRLLDAMITRNLPLSPESIREVQS